MSTVNARMKEAIAAIKSGEKEYAHSLLLGILEDDPENEAALLWMTRAVSTPAEQLVYVERVLFVNPDSEPAQKLKAQLEKANRANEVIKPLPDPEPDPGFDQFVIPQPLIVKLPGSQTLTFSDGLNFGCGFWVAGFLFFVVAVPVGGVALTMILAALGRAN